MGNDGRPLPEKLEEWLNNEGYPFEYFCAHKLRAAGFDVQMGQHLLDSEGTPREIDIIADWMVSADPRQFSFAKIRLTIECTVTKDPWVALLGGKPHGGFVDLFSLPMTRNLAADLDRGTEIDQDTTKTFVGSLNTPRAHGIVHAFRKGDKPDRAYAYLQKASTMARAQTERLDRMSQSGREAMVVIPVVAVDGPLFTAAPSPDFEKCRIQACGHFAVHWGAGTSHSLVFVVGKSQMESFALRAWRDIRTIWSCLACTLDGPAGSGAN